MMVCGCCFLSVALASPATAYTPDTLTVTFLDVGQGDAILVQAPNGPAMLVNAGESWAAPAVSAGLDTEGIGRLEYVVATHGHADHIGGMVGVLPSVTVGTFVSNGVPASTQTAVNLRTYLSSRGIPTDTATAGDSLALDPANVTVLNPPPDPCTDQNEASVVLRLVFGGQSFPSPATPEPRPGGGCSPRAGPSRRGFSRSATTGAARRAHESGINLLDSAAVRSTTRPSIPGRIERVSASTYGALAGYNQSNKNKYA